MILKAYDEQIATKASKVEFFELRNTLEKKISIQDMEDSENILIERIQDFKGELDEFKDTLDEIQRKMSDAVVEAVKGAHRTIIKGQEKLMKRRQNKETIEHY